jgi:hypothetical protein
LNEAKDGIEKVIKIAISLIFGKRNKSLKLLRRREAEKILEKEEERIIF